MFIFYVITKLNCFKEKEFPEVLYSKEVSARSIFRAASYCLVKIIYSASCRTIIAIQKWFLATFFRPFQKVVATPFLVMLYFSGDSTNVSGSGYEIGY